MVLIDLAPLGLTELARVLFSELAWLSCQNWPPFLGDLACRSVAELAERS